MSIAALTVAYAATVAVMGAAIAITRRNARRDLDTLLVREWAAGRAGIL